ncbi:MAG: response regulator [Desulfosarcinaceae bacterium]|nr:response regulator [Desulfosarcinaceae bacterium]
MKIILADDDKVSLELLERQLTLWGYTVATACDGQQAWHLLQVEPVSVVVSDWLMPEMDGLTLCRKIRETGFKHYIYIILISGQDTRQDIVEGLEAGADDFITKPINLAEFRARLQIAARVVNLEAALNQRYKEIESSYYQTLQMFTQLMESFDETLGGHCLRVSRLARQLATRHPAVDEEAYDLVETAGLLHDIGMVGLSPELLAKRRTEMCGDEQQQFLSHPVRSELLLKNIDQLKPVAKIVRAHHEQHNGRGFPDNLAGADIPMTAQLVSAASIYDNLRHRGKVDFAQIPDHLQRLCGYQLSPELIDLLLAFNMDLMKAEQARTDTPLSLAALDEGMILADDVRMKTGAIVMAADTQLNHHHIDKLKGYLALGNINDQVIVYKETRSS